MQLIRCESQPGMGWAQWVREDLSDARMAAQELEQVNRLAQEQGRSLSNMVRQICLAGLSQMQGDTKASAKTAGVEP